MKQIPYDYDQRVKLGTAYVRAIEEIRSDRRELVQTWRQANEDYEGKAPLRDFPWPKNISSNAVVPIVATHTDAIWSRLYNTATGQDPIYYTEQVGALEIDPAVSATDFVRGWQTLSQYVETVDVPIKHTLALALLIAVQYGDAIIYAPHVSKMRYEYTLDPDSGEWAKSDEMVETKGKPELKVLHPENFYIPIHEHGVNAIQDAKFVAYDFELDYDAIAHLKADGTYPAEYADVLLELLRPNTSNDKDGYFREQGDTQIFTDGDQDIRRQILRLAGLDEELRTGKLRMYHVWAREDTDKDGFEEEIQFHVHAGTGLVPHITWNFYEHKKRPFVKFSYAERAGNFYSIGVPEMLANIQKIINQLMRDILDNNKVQNTKIFIARKMSGIDPETRLFPGRILFVDNPAADFIPADLGSGKSITSVNDLFLLQQWGERRTGITDFNLGQERTSRTPATTTLALLEEANKRIDLVIRRLRLSMEELWDMVISLYVQYGFSDEAIYKIMGDNADVVQAAIDNMSVADVREKLRFYARVSTQNLNRSVRRQEAVTEFGQMQAFNQEVLGLVQAIKTNTDPALRELLLSIYRGYRRIITKFLDTFDERNQEEINPDLEPQMAQTELGVANAIPTLQAQAGAGSPLSEAAGLAEIAAGGGGPIAPPGRPVGGQERVPQGTPEERNLA